MIICLLSGILSPMLNIGLASGNNGADGMQERAIHYGVGLKWNNNPTWCVGVGAGFIVNAILFAIGFIVIIMSADMDPGMVLADCR